MKGFRPGKAPRRRSLYLYGGRIHADVAQRLVDSTLNQALAERQVPALFPAGDCADRAQAPTTRSIQGPLRGPPDIAEVKWEGFEVKAPR